MFSLDPALVNVLLIAAVVTLSILFVVVLVKINPSTETAQNIQAEIDADVDRPKAIETSPTPRHSVSEITKQEKTITPTRTEVVVRNNDCLHYYGYLRTLPKNTPIPDECLGCQRVVECLVKAKTQEG